MVSAIKLEDEGFKLLLASGHTSLVKGLKLAEFVLGDFLTLKNWSLSESSLESGLWSLPNFQSLLGDLDRVTSSSSEKSTLISSSSEMFSMEKSMESSTESEVISFKSDFSVEVDGRSATVPTASGTVLVSTVVSDCESHLARSSLGLNARLSLKKNFRQKLNCKSSYSK